MDRERYKRKIRQYVPQRRPINRGERITTHEPDVITPVQKQPVAPTSPQIPTRNVKKPTNHPERPALFDDDDDIFGIWQKQQEAKKERKAREAAEKAAKKAAKLARQQQRKAAKAQGAPTEIAINVTVPSLKKIKVPKSLRYNPEYKKSYLTAGALLVLPLLILGVGIVVHNGGQKSKQPAVLGQTATAAKPDFKTVKPTTTENQATQLKYDTDKKVASYNDVLNNVPITVSQQPLPSSFVADPTGKVEELAKQMNANDKISTSDVTAFSGISIKGPQTIIFTKNDLLIFIFADKKIDTISLEKYIESMR